jgi:hypothetical protein
VLDVGANRVLKLWRQITKLKNGVKIVIGLNDRIETQLSKINSGNPRASTNELSASEF